MCSVAVVIPARDEADGIDRALAALAAQRGAPPFEVLLLVNNCRDETAARARAWQKKLCLSVQEVTLPPAEANVVGARRRALDWGAELAGAHGVVVSTDADTEAHPDWLSGLLAPLRAGADASAGRILLRAAERQALPDTVRATHLLDTGYRMAAAALRARVLRGSSGAEPTHWQHFGANLALRVSAYRAVGGLPDVPCLEDMALVAALERADLKLVHTHAARVWTSARRSGRVPVGLSTQLAEWETGPAAWRVPGGDEVLAEAHAEAAARGGAGAAALARAWCIDECAAREALTAPTLGLRLEHLRQACDRAGHWQRHFPPVPVRQALWEVRAHLEDWGGGGLATRRG